MRQDNDGRCYRVEKKTESRGLLFMDAKSYCWLTKTRRVNALSNLLTYNLRAPLWWLTYVPLETESITSAFSKPFCERMGLNLPPITNHVT